jgi:hypothetical protein
MRAESTHTLDHEAATGDATFPILIGGVGGSGTRLFAESFLDAGLRTLNDANDAGDSLGCALLFKRPELLAELEDPIAIERLWSIVESAVLGGRPLTIEQRKLLNALRKVPRPMHTTWWLRGRARRCIRDAKRPPTPGRWFVKEPNLHWPSLKLLELRPDYRFMMVVRHGVDMAFSSNQQQLIVWGAAALGQPELPIDPAASLRYWCLVHRRFLKLQARYPERVMAVSFDQLCAQPEKILRRVFEFAHITSNRELITRCIENVKPPASLDRHRNEDCTVFDSEDREFAESFMKDIQFV